MRSVGFKCLDFKSNLLDQDGDNPVFGNISDTACWVAALRALETERLDACIVHVRH
ncbi:MAG: hypothetical protein ABIQ95_01665 [Bdellovibrionia bacterium]